jgi:hypothetical protein
MEISFKFITPRNLEELEPYLCDLSFLSTFFPWRQFKQVALDSVPNLTLVYDDATGIILGAFALDIFKKTVELYGVCRLDLKAVLPDRASLIMKALTKVIFEAIFKDMNKQTLIIKVLDDSPGGKGFALKNGFKYINKEKRMTVYRLKRDEYLKREIA